MKKSFILYTDIYEAITTLPNDVAGELFKLIFEYEREEQSKKGYSHEAFIAFSFIKPALDRNNEKYEEICERNRKNGMLGGRPKTQINPENPVGYLGSSGFQNTGKRANSDNPDEAKKTQINPENLDNDNDNDIKKKYKEENSLLPLTNTERYQIAHALRVDFMDVVHTEKAVLDPENIKKYRLHNTARTVRKWLSRGIRLGNQRTLDEMGMILLETTYRRHCT